MTIDGLKRRFGISQKLQEVEEVKLGLEMQSNYVKQSRNLGPGSALAVSKSEPTPSETAHKTHLAHRNLRAPQVTVSDADPYNLMTEEDSLEEDGRAGDIEDGGVIVLKKGNAGSGNMKTRQKPQ